MLPLAEEPECLVLAMVDPLDRQPVNSFRLLSGKPVSVRVATPSDVELMLERLYGGAQNSMDGLVDEIDAADDLGSDEDVDRLRDLASEARSFAWSIC